MTSISFPPRRLVPRCVSHVLTVLALAFATTALPAQSPAPLATELAAIEKRVAAKTADGRRTEADFASEIAELDALLARHLGKTDETINIAFAKALLYRKAIRRTPWMASTQLAISSTPLASEFAVIEKRIGQKLADGKNTEADFAPEIADIDALLVKYPAKTDEAAMVIRAKVDLYAQVIKRRDRAVALLNQMIKDYPETADAKRLVAMRNEAREIAAESGARQQSAIGKPAPEIHFEWASRPGRQKLSELKGRVVVVDFWATWCGPCIASFPALRKHAAHFAVSPVTFLGVTSFQGYVMLDKHRVDAAGDQRKEIQLTAEFAKKMDMSWDVVIGREKVFNPDYGVRGIPHVAIIAPDGTVRHNGLNPLRDGKKIEEHVAALLKEFNLQASTGDQPGF